MKRFLLLMLVLCLLLCACASPDAGESSTPSTGLPANPSTGSTGNTSGSVDPSDDPSADPSQPSGDPAGPSADPSEPSGGPSVPSDPTDPSDGPQTPVIYRNPLTGEVLDSPYTGRPVAVIINNIKSALPQHGVSSAQIVCEIVAEGGVTRCLAVYSDISKASAIGSVRSARTYFLSLAMSFDAVFVHAGSSSYYDEMLAGTSWDTINGLGSAGKYFYRNQDRLNSGYASEHTLFTGGTNIANAIKDFGIAGRENVSYGWQFADKVNLNGQTANKVTVSFRSRGKTTELTYNPETGTYFAYQHGGDYVDGNTGETMDFRNVLVLFAKTTQAATSSHVFAELTGSGTGYLAVDGKAVAINWSRGSEKEPFVYTLADGTPVTFGVGTTYMAVVPTGSPIVFG